MKFDEMGLMCGKTLMLLPGTACDYQTNEQWLFGEEKYAIPVLKAIDEFMEDPV